MSTRESTKLLIEALLARRVPHAGFMKAYERGKELLGLRDLGMPGTGFMGHGASGIGKTALADALVEHAIAMYGPDAVMRTLLSTGATVKGVMSDLLAGFGDPLPKRGTTRELVKRLKDTIMARSCRLIIIDETQHLMPGGNPSKALIDSILNALKLLDESGVSIILLGTDEILRLWNADKQIRSRFQTTYQFLPLMYPADRPTWRGVVAKFVQTLQQHGVTVECPNLDDRLHAACNGHLRPLVLILITAVAAAHAKNSAVITSEDLHNATLKQVDNLDGNINAFNLDLQEVQRHSETCHSTKVLAPTPRGLHEVLRQ